MHLLFWIAIITVINWSTNIQCSKIDKFKNLLQQIILKQDFHQIIAFTSIIDNQQEEALQVLNEQLPVMLMSLSASRIKNGIFSKSSFVNAYIIFYTGLELTDLYRIFSEIVQISPKSARPKCLIILYENISVKNILLQAWSLKYLDVSIIEWSNFRLTTYNPFNNSIITATLNSKSVVFPDKLRDLFGYNFTVPIYHHPPHLIVTSDHTNKTMKIQGAVGYDILRIISAKMNFTIDALVELEKKTLNTMLRDFDSQHARMFVIPVLVNALNKSDFMISKIFMNQSFVIIAPVIRIADINVPMNLFIYLCFFILMMFFLFLASKFFRIEWTAIDIFQILLGIELEHEPVQLAARIIYTSSFLVSMYFSSETFAKLTDIKLASREKPFDTFNEIVETKIPIYMSRLFSNEVYSRTEEVSKHLIVKPRIYEKFDDCLSLLKRRKAFCITNDIHGKLIVDADKKRIMKLARPTLYPDKTTFFYESGSPVGDTIDHLFLRIYESGIPLRWEARRLSPKSLNTMDDRKVEKNIFAMQLFIIMICGYAIASIVFVCEFAVKVIKGMVE